MKRLCKCGCGKRLVQMKGEQNTNFDKRKFIAGHGVIWRKNRPGGWHGTTAREKFKNRVSEDEAVPRCEECGKMIMEIRRDGFGVTDRTFCICGRKWDEKRRAWV